jgi:hypothetical protein
MLAPRPSLPDQYNALARRKDWWSCCDATLAFENADLAAIAGIWQAARGARPMPLRNDLTPRALGRHLRNIAFVERVALPAARRYRFGFFGSGLARRMGDRTGMFIDEVIAPPYIDAWHEGYDMMCAWKAPLRFVSVLRSLNLEYLSTESAVMPFADETGAVSCFLLSAAFTPLVK